MPYFFVLFSFAFDCTCHLLSYYPLTAARAIIFLVPDFFKDSAASKKVAPEVETSSIRIIFLPEKFSGDVTLKQFLAFYGSLR